jgi:hypothetical protein
VNELDTATEIVAHCKSGVGSAKGVEFIQPPSPRPYGTEALCRDNSGNWLVLIQPSNQPVSADDFEPATADRH